MNLPQAYSTAFNILYCFGLAPFQFSRDRTKTITRFVDNFSVLVGIFMIAIGSLVVFCFRTLVETIMNIDVSYDFNQMISLTQRVQVWISALAYVVLLISSITKKRAHIKLFDSLISLDNDMETLFHFKINYKNLRNYNLFLIFLITYTIIFTYCMVIYVTYMRNNFIQPYMIPIYGATLCYPLFNTFHYCVMCKIIIDRLKTVENLSKSNMTLQRFCNLANINSRLKQTVHNLNDALGLGQFLNIMNNNIVITLQVYIVLRMIISKDGNAYLHWNIGSIWWLVMFVLENVFTAKVGNDLKIQVLTTNKMLLGNTLQRYRSKEIEFLSGCSLHQFIYGNNVKCTAGGFFVIDHSLNMLMISTITSYIIILVQFQQEEY